MEDQNDRYRTLTVAFSLTPREVDYIAKVNDDHNLHNMSAALRLIISEHAKTAAKEPAK